VIRCVGFKFSCSDHTLIYVISMVLAWVFDQKNTKNVTFTQRNE
jgi:hypothetical protein